MTNLQRYARAVFPSIHRCLGRRLEPLSVGHLLLLIELDHPLVNGRDQVPDAASLAEAVLLCSLSFAQARRLTRWPRVAALLQLPIAWAARRREPYQRAFAAMVAYLEESLRGPRTSRPDHDGTPCHAPFWTSVVCCLMGDLNRTLDEVMGMPCGHALWLANTVWETRGAVQLASNEEQELLEELRA